MHSVRFSVLVICVGLVCFPTASSPASIPSKDRLLGSVRSVVITKPYATETLRFDRSGKLIERLRSRPESTKYNYKFLFSYDDRGREVECEIYERDKSSPDKRHTRYSENKNGNPTAAVTVFDNGTLDHVTFFGYDDSGPLLRSEQSL